MSDFVPDPEAGFERLTGEANYSRWTRGFETLAKLKGVWSLFTGEEDIIQKTSPITQDYTAQNVRVQVALGLLEFWVEPDIRYDINTQTCPRITWMYLEDEYRNADIARTIAGDALHKLQLCDCKDMADYLRKHRMLRADLQDTGVMFTNREFAELVMGNLSAPYNCRKDATYLETLTSQGELKVLTRRLLWLEKENAEEATVLAHSS
ncbi:hypothetical protein PV11_09660 [Exophiala sideris]|uniref:DUF4219 domain-containing protein n=1 Tax=Exophiala sideris TaxID=1016849 RepID=A0A0D1Y4X6_9EURO|nr:hypothetical protein PV11_09660 [Exophiala sideris]